MCWIGLHGFLWLFIRFALLVEIIGSICAASLLLKDVGLSCCFRWGFVMQRQWGRNFSQKTLFLMPSKVNWTYFFTKKSQLAYFGHSYRYAPAKFLYNCFCYGNLLQHQPRIYKRCIIISYKFYWSIADIARLCNLTQTLQYQSPYPACVRFTHESRPNKEN